jgi:hypothetical protein
MIADSPKADNVAFSSHALDLLDCFEGGFGDVVVAIAEHFARQRLGEDASTQPIEVEAQDVRRAGQMVAVALRSMAATGQMSPELIARVAQMDECFSCKDQ